MRLVGCLLLLSGGLIAFAALVLLGHVSQRYVFVGAALGVEVLGLWLLAQSYRREQLATKVEIKTKGSR